MFNSNETLSLKSASVKQCLQISKAFVMSSGVSMFKTLSRDHDGATFIFIKITHFVRNSS